MPTTRIGNCLFVWKVCKPMCRRPKLFRPGGFTLTEILVTLAVIGIVASAAASNVLPQLPRYRLQGAATQLAWNLRTLRMRAISQHHAITVTFTNNHVYTVWTDKNDNSVVDANEVQTTDINTAYGGVTVASTNNPVFNPTGVVSNLAVITLTGAGSTRVLTMTAAGGITLN